MLLLLTNKTKKQKNNIDILYTFYSSNSKTFFFVFKTLSKETRSNMANIFRIFSQILETCDNDSQLERMLSAVEDAQTEAEKYECQMNILNALAKALTEKDKERREREDHNIWDVLIFKLLDIIIDRYHLASTYWSEWPWSIIETDLGLTDKDTTKIYWMGMADRPVDMDICYATAKSATVDKCEDSCENIAFWRRILKIIYPQEK